MDIQVVTICGSMRYSEEMMRIAEALEVKNGYAVIQCAYTMDEVNYDEADIRKLAAIHRKKIDISDAIYVVNIDGYIGSSTKNEIAYARQAGKAVLYHEEISPLHA